MTNNPNQNQLTSPSNQTDNQPLNFKYVVLGAIPSILSYIYITYLNKSNESNASNEFLNPFSNTQPSSNNIPSTFYLIISGLTALSSFALDQLSEPNNSNKTCTQNVKLAKLFLFILIIGLLLFTAPRFCKSRNIPNTWIICITACATVYLVLYECKFIPTSINF